MGSKSAYARAKRASQQILKAQEKRREQRHENYKEKRRNAVHQWGLEDTLRLSPDTQILFLKKGDSFDKPPLELSYGTVVCLDRDTHELLLVARFHERSSADNELFQKFKYSISLIYNHGKARYQIKNNSAVNAMEGKVSYKGKMHAIGFRGGYDKNFICGVYSLNPSTSKFVARMKEDLQHQRQLPKVQQFLHERFTSLSLSAYQANREIALATGAPSWDSSELGLPQKDDVFGSNIVITFDGFCNAPHSDDDATKFAIGLFATIERSTGALFDETGDGARGKIEGSRFIFSEYNFAVNYDNCDGVVEQVWNTKILHHTPETISYDSKGNVVLPKRCDITRFGSSVQITQKLVDRLDKLKRLEIKQSDVKNQSNLCTFVNGYNSEYSKKIEKHLH